jgi:hypothetical protein
MTQGDFRYMVFVVVAVVVLTIVGAWVFLEFIS